MKKILSFVFAAMFAATTANAAIILNEVIGSTTGADAEFIELYNSGPGSVDISGFYIDEVESDSGNASFGTVDDTFSIPDGSPIILAPGDFYLIGNSTFETEYGIVPDLSLSLSIENSSYTLALYDDSDSLLYTALVVDGDGALPAPFVAADITVGPDGSFLPAGYALDVDGGSTASILEFSPVPAPSATPGASNNAPIPEPSTVALLMLGAVAASAASMRSRLG